MSFALAGGRVVEVRKVARRGVFFFFLDVVGWKPTLNRATPCPAHLSGASRTDLIASLFAIFKKCLISLDL